jgi:hypothetical protein
MAIPQFSATDHYEFKKWASALRDRMRRALQQLDDALDDRANSRSVLEKGLAAADAEITTLREAPKRLPPNLAEMLREYTGEYAQDLADVADKARKRLEG